MTPKLADEAGVYRVQVLERVFAILNAVAQNRAGLGAAALSSRLGLHKSTAHRLLTVLECNHYLMKDPSDGKYRLGWKLIELGMHALSRMDLRELAWPQLGCHGQDACHM